MTQTQIPTAKILVVDDEKNIRLTVAQSLETQGYEVKTALNGEEGLQRLAQEHFDLMLLDLQMPGMDGMKVLSKAIERMPELTVIIVSAHGTVENAVDAMKLGAVDFLQKPFTPKEIRELVDRVLARSSLDADSDSDYETLTERAKYLASQRQFDEASALARQAIGVNPDRPEAFNLLGELEETLGNRLEGLKKYRAAIELDPTYKPARQNLDRATTDPKNRPNLG
ncbi:MAG: response regulator [Cyanobacteriota bacterium]|nr:response regulator [Cyanobacteriota bacterium]